MSPFLQTFWDLAAVDLQTREEAAAQLVKHLKGQTEPGNKSGFPGWSMDMVYTVTRLCRGICSSHDCARQGFSLALTYPFFFITDSFFSPCRSFLNVHLLPAILP